MEQTVTARAQVRDIGYLLQKLIGKYSPLQIYCFHKDENSMKTEGCFVDFRNAGYCDYWLLMIIDGGSRIESAVQDFVNAHYDFGSVTILVHGREGIEKSINDGYLFFANVCGKGKLLYSRPAYNNALAAVLPASIERPEGYRKQYAEGMSRAEGFLHGATECLAAKKYNVCAFMLHQAVEQCCHALIGLHLDYRCDSHNLYRLLMLCRCFTELPYQLFITARDEDKVIFDKLVKSYCGARYGLNFKIEVGEIAVLIERVSGLIGITRQKI